MLSNPIIQKIRRILYLFTCVTLLLALSSCSNKESNSSENYYSIDPDTTESYSELSFVSDFVKTKDNIFVVGKGIVDSKKNDKIEYINVSSSEIFEISLDELDKAGCSEIYSIFPADNFIVIYYFDINNNTTAGIWNTQTSEMITTISLDVSETVSDGFRYSDNTICISSISVIQYGIILKNRFYEISTGEWKNEQEFLLRNSIYARMYKSEDSNESIVLDVCNDNTDDNYSISLKKVNSDGVIFFKSDSMIYSSEQLYGTFLNLAGNVCVAYRNNNDLLYIDELSVTDGSLINSYYCDIALDCKIAEGIFSDFDFVYYDYDSVYGYTLLDNKSKFICKIELDESFKNTVTGNYDRIIVRSVDNSINQENMVLKLDSQGNSTELISFNNISYSGVIVGVDVIENDVCFVTLDEGKINIYQYDGWNKITDISKKDGVYELLEFCTDISGNIYIIYSVHESSEIYISMFNPAGEEMYSNVIGDSTEMNILDAAKFNTDGIIFAYINSDNKIVVSCIKSLDQSIVDLFTVECDNINMLKDFKLLQGDNQNEFYYKTSEGVFAYNGSDNFSKILDWIDSDIYMNIITMCFKQNKEILAYAFDYETNKNEFVCFSKVDDETLKKIKSRKEITVGGYNLLSSELYNIIKEYNKNNNRSHIKVIDYSAGSFDDLNGKVTFVQNIPDIIIGDCSNEILSEKYCTDLTSFIESMDNNEYFGNILKIYQNSQGIRKVPVSFDAVSFECSDEYANYSNLGEFSEYSISENNRLKFKDTEDLINKYIISNISTFADFNDKTCNFSTKDFIDYLNYIRLVNNSDNKLHEVSTDLVSLCNYFGIVELEIQRCREPIFTGVPGLGLCQNIMIPELTVSISEKCENIDLATDFLKILLDDDYQRRVSSGYPVKKDIFIDKVIEERNDLYFMYGGGVLNQGGHDYELSSMKNEYLDSVIIPEIESTVVYRVTDDNIISIVKEEIIDFLNDPDKSSSETASNIQRRITLYMNES